MENVRVSVIVPIYKVEQTLDRCVKSIHEQSYRNLEIILVDDGSPDRCPQMCDEYASTDNRIIVIHKKNGGLSDARNAGIKKSTGEYIAFVDSDDYVEPNYISSMLQLAEKNNSDLVVCSFYDEDPQRSTVQLPDISIGGRQLFIDATKKSKWQYIVAWNKLYKRELCLPDLFEVGKQHEDEFAFHKILCSAKNVSVTSSLLYHYTYNKDSIMNSSYSVKNLDRADAFLQRLIYVQHNKIFGVQDYIINDIVGDFIAAYSKLNVKTDVNAKAIISRQQSQLRKLLINGLWWRLSLKNKIKFMIFVFSPELFMHILLKKLPK